MSMNWRSRLTVSVEAPGSETPIRVTPIDALQPSFSFQAEPVHSIEDTHLGVIYSPDQEIVYRDKHRVVGLHHHQCHADKRGDFRCANSHLLGLCPGGQHDG